MTGFQEKDIVLVEDADGFDIPMPVRECVVIETDDYNVPTPAARLPRKDWRINRRRVRMPQQRKHPLPLLVPGGKQSIR